MAAASQSASEEGESATCPLCGDYEGQPSSVEAHISRMTDPVHRGEVGRAHRDQLEREVAESSGVESSEDQEVESSEEQSSMSSELDSSDDQDIESSEESESSESTEDFRESRGVGHLPLEGSAGQGGDLEDEQRESEEIEESVEGEQGEKNLRDEFDQLAERIEFVEEQIEGLEKNMPSAEEYERFQVAEGEGSESHGVVGESSEAEDGSVVEEEEGPGLPGVSWMQLGVGIAGLGALWFLYRRLSASGNQSSGGSQQSGQSGEDDDISLIG